MECVLCACTSHVLHSYRPGGVRYLSTLQPTIHDTLPPLAVLAIAASHLHTPTVRPRIRPSPTLAACASALLDDAVPASERPGYFLGIA